jgi:UDP-N-acetylmuramoyl-L-alanyl-D-glutamate--2,6-diaminopimelate ligase
MRLAELLALDQIESIEGDIQCEVTGLAYDSRQAAAGSVFFAIRGENSDGHDFLQHAADRGAVALVVARAMARPTGTVLIRVADVRRAMGLWSAYFFGAPSRRLRLVGITGTNGKTTCSYLVESMAAAAGMTPGVIGTINYRYGAHHIPSHHTTPESVDLESLLADMVRSGVNAVAMEVSSHALAQERVRGLEFDAALFTNLSRDHLDYHASMEDYFAAKSKLFTDYLAGGGKPKRSAVIYGPDPHGAELVEMIRGTGLEIWTYGEESQWNVHPVDVQSDVAGLRGKIRAADRAIEFSSSMIGAANLQNILGATAVACALGLKSEAIAAGIERLAAVPGRLEKVENKKGVSVLVDYAHTPDALEKVLQALRPVTAQRGGRLIAVFGAGGDRDAAKRPLMGAVVSRMADHAVVTSDNPRSEDPRRIIGDIESGMADAHEIEPDRARAIERALAGARDEDVVLIAGKGHENYQEIAGERRAFSDAAVARAALAARRPT